MEISSAGAVGDGGGIAVVGAGEVLRRCGGLLFIIFSPG
jgi:hypothetical protein